MDGVTFKAESTHFIDGWATPPEFSGGEGDSADELSAVMEDIRWSAAPSPVTFSIEGLDPGATVEVQILVNEGDDRNRRWDIAVEGRTGSGRLYFRGMPRRFGRRVEPRKNSFVYRFEAQPSGDGILNVEMQQDIGGEPSPGGDNNPILQGVIVHRAGAPRQFQITDIVRSEAELTITWSSVAGREYSVEYSDDISKPIWIELDDGVVGEGDETSFTDDFAPRVGAANGWYRVRDNN